MKLNVGLFFAGALLTGKHAQCAGVCVDLEGQERKSSSSGVISLSTSAEKIQESNHEIPTKSDDVGSMLSQEDEDFLQRMEDLRGERQFHKLKTLVSTRYKDGIPLEHVEFLCRSGAIELVSWLFTERLFGENVTTDEQLRLFRMLAENSRVSVTDEELWEFLTTTGWLSTGRWLFRALDKVYVDRLLLLAIQTERSSILYRFVKLMGKKAIASRLIFTSKASESKQAEYTTPLIEVAKKTFKDRSSLHEMCALLYEMSGYNQEMINRTDSKDKSALYYAAENGNAWLVNFLYNRGATTSQEVPL